jgi:hypothetical protein
MIAVHGGVRKCEGKLHTIALLASGEIANRSGNWRRWWRGLAGSGTAGEEEEGENRNWKIENGRTWSVTDS